MTYGQEHSHSADGSRQISTNRSILQEQVKLLINRLPVSVATSMIIALVLAYAMRSSVDSTRLGIWLAGMACVSFGRLALWNSFRRRGFLGQTPERWLAIFQVAAIAAGSAWGSAAILIFPAGDLTNQVVMGFVLATMSAGGMSTLAVHFKTYVLFLLPVALPYSTRMMMETGGQQHLLALLFSLGFIFLLLNARRFAAVTVNSLSLNSENDRLVDALRTALGRAEEASLAKTQFLANMSHEIRTPLSGILGMSELLRKTQLTPHQGKLATTLTRSAKSLLSLVEDVLDISRIETGKFTLHEQEFSLRQCVEDAVEMCAGASYAKGLEVHLVTRGALPSLVMGDAPRLRQVLVNLMGNSIKFTETGTISVRLDVECRSPGVFAATFCVSDTGIGIAAQDIERLFSPFTQADASTQRRFGGTGLGLAITRHLVQQMGGEVRLESQLGKGTSAIFTIPLPAAAKFTLEQEPAQLAGKRILVLDDRASSREAIASMISPGAARIEMAVSEADALAKLRRAAELDAPYDLLVVDRIRPRTESISFLHKLCASCGLDQTRVVALMSSNWHSSPTLERGVPTCTFLNKPPRRAELLAAIVRSLSDAADTAKAPADPGMPVTLRVDEPVRDPLKGLKVLVAEDNPVNQEVMLTFLEGFGCMTVLANNGLEAVDASAATQFNMVLMDCQMPQLDGLAAIRRIRTREQASRLPRIPIVMVTANAFDSDQDQAFAAGADAFLSKPFNEDQLEQIIRDSLAHTQSSIAA